MWRSVLPFVLLAACGGGKTTDSDLVVPPPPETTETGSTTDTTTDLPGGSFIDATFFAVIVRFAYDPKLGQAVEFANPGEGFSSLQFELALFDSDAIYVGANETNNCSVILEFPGPVAEAKWTKKQGAWFGIDVPSSATVTDLCANFSFPSEFQGDVGAAVSKWTWGAGIDELSQDMRVTLDQSLPPAEWAALEDYALGGWLKSNLFMLSAKPTLYNDFGFGVAYTVDGNFEIDISGAGNTIPILASEVEQKVGVARAYYELTFGLYGPGTILTTPLPGP